MTRSPFPWFVALSCAALAFAGPRPADAAEGRLPVRPGDTVRGTLRRCYERQVAEVELLRGEVFRIAVRSTHVDNEPVLLRVLDPTGFPSNPEANVRQVGGEIVAGPFRVERSGTWSFEISTLSAHGAQYEARTDVRRTRPVRATLGGRRRGALLAIPAGATIRVAGRTVPSLSLRRPGESTAEVLAERSAALDALRGPGLAAPRSGTYEIGLATGGRGSVRIVATPPRRGERGVVEFPTLPADASSFASWQGAGGWLVDPTRKAPDEEGRVAPPSDAPPRTSPFSGSLADDAPAPGEAAPPLALGDASAFVGPASGVGLPSAGIPRLEDVVAQGRLDEDAAGPSYVLTRRSDALGAVTTRVWFLVDGRPAKAPLAIDGRVSFRWTDAGGAQDLAGSWTMTFDPDRGVQVLDGAEGRSPDGARTITSAAAGFALPALPGSWPQGRLAFAVRDPRFAADFTRTETFDGGAAVTVAVVQGDGTTETVVHGFGR